MEETLKTVMSFQGATATQLSSSTKSLRKPSNLASKGEEVLETAKAEMSQVREENSRLKMLLQKIESEYKSLKMHVEDNYFQQQQQPEIVIKNNEESEEHELISLCLGTNNRNVSKEYIGEVFNRKKGDEDDEELKKYGNYGLKLGLSNYDQKSKFEVAFPSPDNNNNSLLLSTENKEEGEKWQANKGLKAMRNGDKKDDVSQINTVKRARVSVRARCSTPTMNDGCQWRKYGQKIAKSNPCPRAYYRCTVGASCPVRKQVQRCAEDTSILITTYEGTHNHPLPISATAMASTTSAAASMLLSGSSSSPPAVAPPPNLTSSTAFHGFNINNLNTQPFYMSNPSSSPPFPTITLDLTASPPSTSSSPFNMAGAATTTHGLYPFTGLGYPRYSYSNVLPNLANGTTPFLNRTQNIASFQTPGRPLQEHFFQSPMQKKHELMSSGLSSSSQQDLTETLTRAITSDPNFRSVIAAAISTMNNGGDSSSAHDQSNSNVEMLDRKLKWDDQENSTVGISSPAPAAHQAI